MNGQLGLRIQQAMTQAKISQDKGKNNGNLEKKGAGSTSMVVIPISDIKKKMERKQPSRSGNEV